MILSIFKGLILIFSSEALKKHSLSYLNRFNLWIFARDGKEVDIKSRQISVDEFKITNIRGLEIDFKIQCSKGTYIRSLVNDFGKALDSGAHLSSLRRINIGRYSVNDAIKIKDFTEKLWKKWRF